MCCSGSAQASDANEQMFAQIAHVCQGPPPEGIYQHRCSGMLGVLAQR